MGLEQSLASALVWMGFFSTVIKSVLMHPRLSLLLTGMLLTKLKKKKLRTRTNQYSKRIKLFQPSLRLTLSKPKQRLHSLHRATRWMWSRFVPISACLPEAKVEQLRDKCGWRRDDDDDDNGVEVEGGVRRGRCLRSERQPLLPRHH